MMSVLLGAKLDVFADLDALKAEIFRREETNFISVYIFESIPFIFNGNIEAWVSWKAKLGELIEVDPRDIVLTGSSAIGYSLNPHKNFKPFGQRSDVDCGVVSPHHFDLAWRYLRQRRVEWLSLPVEIKQAINIHRTNYIFSGTIATDQILTLLPFGAKWSDALTAMSKIEPTASREVKLRIYKDFDALRGYQAIGLRDAKGRIAEAQRAEENQEIPTEDA